MRNSVLPVMTVLTVIAGAVGLQMGESAIAQIDPLYFQGSVAPARDVSKGQPPQRAPGFAQASGWEEGYAARARDCPGCPAGPMTISPAVYEGPQAPLYAYSDPTIEPRWDRAAAPAPQDDLRIDRALHVSQVQRYLHYPVTADQDEIRAGLDGEVVEVEEVEAPVGL